MTVAIILAGGTGTRVGAAVPKQFVEVEGKPIVAYTAAIYEAHPEVDAILIVCHSDYIEHMQNIARTFALSKVQWVIPGGNTFLDSLRNGIQHLHTILQPDDIIMVHYAAAPFTSQAMLSDSLRVCRLKGNAVCAIPCYQLMGSNDHDKSIYWLDRDTMVQITCPYSFHYGFVAQLYAQADAEGITQQVEPHTTTLMQHMGYPLYLSKGDQTNIKITTADDLRLFRGWVLAGQD